MPNSVSTKKTAETAPVEKKPSSPKSLKSKLVFQKPQLNKQGDFNQITAGFWGTFKRHFRT
jgi:hypothetical protein